MGLLLEEEQWVSFCAQCLGFCQIPEDKHFYQPLTLFKRSPWLLQATPMWGANQFPKAGVRHELLLSRITQYLNIALKTGNGNASTLEKSISLFFAPITWFLTVLLNVRLKLCSDTILKAGVKHEKNIPGWCLTPPIVPLCRSPLRIPA